MWLREARTHVRYAGKNEFVPVARFNGTSDVKIETEFPEIFEAGFAHVYDYTKDHTRFGNVPSGYHLTYSLAETASSRRQAERLLADGHNVAVVFGRHNVRTGKPLQARTGYDVPSDFMGAPTFDGDADDLRFRDPKGGHVIALRAKGTAVRDTSGFVQWLD